MIHDTHIRAAQPTDAHQIARIYVDTWRATYADILPRGYLEQMSYEHSARSFSSALMDSDLDILVAEETSQLAGYVAGGLERTGDPIFEAEIYELYLFPAFQRRGTGSRLMAAMAQRLHRRRLHSLKIWVLSANPNRRFYHRTGGVFLNSRAIPFAGQRCRMDAYGWFDITRAAAQSP